MADPSDRPPSLDGDGETELYPGPPTPASSVDGGRFAPGAVIDARYRVATLLGRGGMGEVYRAEDLKLGETVALKFLPEALAADGAALARLHREVKTARSITHPNVVRVHDIGEQDGQPFLSMEYVDGEDLSVLLRRIGRLPGAKGVALARQICAGLAAAHRAGVLHRDLKPANVMIDGEGQAKISDFGLADLAADLPAPDGAGTPLYMAPEQLTEGRASFASDVYALGLVLYEMFTGARPYRASSRAELVARQRDSAPEPPTAHVETLDPLVERAILRCLELDPGDRPSSALDVAGMLPGGDPLAAALAAGETPSPEMVARAAVPGTLARPAALALLLTVLAGIAAVPLLMSRVSVLTFDGLPLEPQVLEHKARAILAEVGRPEGLPGVGWLTQGAHYNAVHRGHARSRDEWSDLAGARPPFMEYVFRAAPDGIEPTRRWGASARRHDPPPTLPGSVTVVLDSRGRLRELLSVPPVEGLAAVEATPDWAPLFAAAGLEPVDWTPAEPSRAPPVYADSVASWRGSYRGQPERPVRIDAAGRGGEVVHWQLVEEGASESGARGVGQPLGLALTLFAAILLTGGWLAVRNFRNGRGDRNGSRRIAVVAASASLIGSLRIGVVLTTGASLSLLFAALAWATFGGLAGWVVYMSLEPVMRRHFPRALVSWSRLVGGRLRDPLIGRDLLAGFAAAGGLMAADLAIREWISPANGFRLVSGFPHGLNPLSGPVPVIGNLFSSMQILTPLCLMFLYVAPRSVIRHRALATATGALALFAFAFFFQGGGAIGALWGLSVVLITARVGFVGLLGFTVFMNNLVLTPVTLDPSAWWAPSSWIGVGVVLILAVWAFRQVAKPVRGDER